MSNGQVALAAVTFNRQKACRYGQMLYNVNDMYVGRSLDLYGEFSEAEVELFRRLVRPGDLVLDIGANIGAHTVFFSRQVGPAGRVLAFEPQRVVFQTLCANIALASALNVSCNHNAVGPERGQINVPVLDYARENNFGGLSLGGTNGDVVPVLTIDSLDLPRCNFMKIDVEGMERAVLAGARGTIARFKPVLYVENDRAERSRELIRFIDGLGYAMYWHKPPLYNPRNFFGNPTNVFGQVISANMLCVHRSMSLRVPGFEIAEPAGPAGVLVGAICPRALGQEESDAIQAATDKDAEKTSAEVLRTTEPDQGFEPLVDGSRTVKGAATDEAVAPAEPQAGKARRESAAELHGSGVRLINEGKAGDALPLLQRAVELKPEAPEYHHNLGVALAHLDRLDEAIAAFRQALRIKPDGTSALSNMALALAQQSKTDEAVAAFEECLRLEPQTVEFRHRLGNVLRNAKKPLDAIPHLQEAVRLRPAAAELHHSLGLALADAGKNEEAIAAYEAALKIDPNYADAHNNLGIVLQNIGRSEEAIAHYRLALRVRPHSSETYNNLGVALAARELFEDAVMAYRSALQLYPESAAAYSNLGNAFRQIGLVEDAITHLDRALELSPSYAEGFNNKAVALVQAGEAAAAVSCYNRALALRPDYPDAYLNRALVRLLLDDYTGGLVDYEWRWKRPGRAMPNWGRPLWDGDDPVGRTILLWGEQGLGDTIHYCRFAAVLAKRGATPLLCVPEPVVRLLRSVPGVAKVESSSDRLPPFACHAPLMSMPKLFTMRSLDEAPAPVPYLSADPAAAAACRERVRAGADLVVGVAWRGNRQYAGDKIRSVPPELFAPLAKIPGVRVVSLMKEAPAEESAAAGAAAIGAEDWADFADTAAAFVNLDLVVSVDTAVAHLAGALGLPVWIALPLSPDMRWGVGREDSPWYPTARLFRQERRAQWGPVFARIADELGVLVRRKLRPAQAIGKTSAAEALHGRGLALLGEGRLQDAAAYLEDAARLGCHLKGTAASAIQLNLGVALAQTGRLDEAIAAFKKAAEHNPDSHLTHANLGLAYIQAQRYAEAADALASAARLDSTSADVHNHLGIALAQLGRDDEAAREYSKAIELRPDFHAPHTNRGNLLRSQGRLDEALACYEKALELCPSEADIYNNRGIAYDSLAQTDRALADYDKALALNPANAETHFNRALALLLQGDYARGLEEYEWRWRRPGRGLLDWGVPAWDGSITPGKTVLVWAEQGLGDVIHCSRFAAWLAERGLNVFVQAPAALVTLLRSLPGVAGVVGPGEKAEGVEAHVPVMSLPRLCGMKRLEDAPGVVPYLKADAARTETCRDKVRAGSRRVIGIVWRGNPGYAGDRARSAPAAAFARLAEVGGVRIVSLMKEASTEELAAARATDIGAAQWSDFAAAAAALANLDLVIAVEHGRRPPGRGAWPPRLDRLAHRARLAVGPGTRGLALVSDSPAFSPRAPG
jgi:FkbM family methyltransferase